MSRASVERRLSEVAERLKDLRAELQVADEQLSRPIDRKQKMRAVSLPFAPLSLDTLKITRHG